MGRPWASVIGCLASESTTSGGKPGSGGSSIAIGRSAITSSSGSACSGSSASIFADRESGLLGVSAAVDLPGDNGTGRDARESAGCDSVGSSASMPGFDFSDFDVDVGEDDVEEEGDEDAGEVNDVGG
jgi:hypothetical protein